MHASAADDRHDKRCRTLEDAAAGDPAAILPAAQQNVQQSRDTPAMLEARRKAGADVTAVQVAQGAYCLADAEYLVKLQGK